jgi:hypothetical protein
MYFLRLLRVATLEKLLLPIVSVANSWKRFLPDLPKNSAAEEKIRPHAIFSILVGMQRFFDA